MAIDFVGTHELTPLVTAMPRTPLAIKDIFFKNKILTDKSKILVEEEIGINDYAARTVDSKLTPSSRKRNANKMTEIEPAYVQELTTITASELKYRLAGEAIGGSLSPNSRLAVLYAKELKKHVDAIDTLLEIWACNALLSGGYAVASDYYQRSPISFGRSASLMPTALSSTDRWFISGAVGATAKPLSNIQTVLDLLYSVSRTRATDIILGANARRGFMGSQEVKDLCTNDYRTSKAEISLDPRTYVGLEWIMQIPQSKINIWSYANTYTNDADSTVDFFNPNAIVFIDSNAFGGTQFNGLIENMKFLEASESYSYAEYKEKGKGIDIVTESAPLIYPTRKNASASWVVC